MMTPESTIPMKRKMHNHKTLVADIPIFFCPCALLARISGPNQIYPAAELESDLEASDSIEAENYQSLK